MLNEIKPTDKAVELLAQGILGHIMIGDKTYIPNCILEMTKGFSGDPLVKIRNQDGIVIAKTENVTFPREWKSNIDIVLSPIAYQVSFCKM